MKKYFLVETEEEIKFGDTVDVALHKDIENGEVIVNKKVTVDEDNVDTLVSLGILEECEMGVEQEGTIHFFEEDMNSTLDEIIDILKEVSDKTDAIEKLLTAKSKK